MVTFKMPKETDEQKAVRNAAIVQATLNAAHIPLHVAEAVVKVMELALKCAVENRVGRVGSAGEDSPAPGRPDCRVD